MPRADDGMDNDQRQKQWKLTTWPMAAQSTVLLMLMPLLLLAKVPNGVHALECIQCDRQALWYSPEENDRHIARCQRGLIPATRCANHSHTHCIYTYYRQGGVLTVTERRCGTAEDITGCTLYKSMRLRRHFVAGSGTDVPPSIGGTPISHRRRETGPLVVEVCNSGCAQDGCVSGALAAGRVGGWTTVLAAGFGSLFTMAWIRWNA